MNEFETPILFIVFNRPEHAQKVFDRIKQIKPKKLFVAADGPRGDIKGDIEKCNAVRKIFSEIDWNCSLQTLFREGNIGCKKGVSGAIDWFFENVDEGIILEDDCLPDPSFFNFCEELLGYYRQNEAVMLISGGNYQLGNRRSEYSYYFSRYTHVWGWATWKNRWMLYDVKMHKWDKIDKKKFLHDIIEDKNEVSYWYGIFNRVFKNEIDTWDYQLLFANWLNHRLSVIPNSNLISNIGFDNSATHTKHEGPFSNMNAMSIGFPLKHPESISRNNEADGFTSRMQYRNNTLRKLKGYVSNKLGRYISS